MNARARFVAAIVLVSVLVLLVLLVPSYRYYPHSISVYAYPDRAVATVFELKRWEWLPGPRSRELTISEAEFDRLLPQFEECYTETGLGSIFETETVYLRRDDPIWEEKFGVKLE